MTAVDTAAAVRAGELTPRQTVQAALDRITANDTTIHAFVTVRAEKALAEADELAARPDLASLPLAGVPVAIKDNVPVAGEPMTIGSKATSRAPQPTDHAVVRRLRDAGAIVVGITAVPEMCMWGATDNPDVVTRNPWNTDRTSGGSSGGAAAAVASGQVDIAHGNDGLGSIRIPSADCGLFGIKPGPGVVPAEFGGNGWYGMSENGPIATTVADAALMLSVLADDPSYATVSGDAPLTIAVAANHPLAGGRTDTHFANALQRAVDLLPELGHAAAHRDLPYPKNPLPLFLRWLGGSAADAKDIADHGGDLSKLQSRTKFHVAVGKQVIKRGLVNEGQRDKIADSVAAYLDSTGADLLMTPALGRPPIEARTWSTKSWAANIWANVNYAPFQGVFNVIGWPAMSVPFGVHPVSNTPLAVHVAGRPGSEKTMLALAAQIESARPWQRVAPGF